MKKIINGKVYNTETAQRLATWESTQDVRSFDYMGETLYRKRTGEFFLHGYGEAGTKYAKRIEQNCWGSGETIIPLSPDAARAWAEESLDGDDYEHIFGEISEDEEDVLINFMVPAALDRKFTDYAAKRGISKSKLLRDYIESLD